MFCFVLSSWDLLNHSTSCHSLGIFRKLWWVGVHWLGLRPFGAIVWKLLLIEPFSQWKLNRIETENCIGILGHSWKALGKSDFIDFISQFSELRCGRYWFVSGFCCWKFKQITKIELGRKIQLSPQCVHTWANTIRTVDRPVVASSPNETKPPKKGEIWQVLKKKNGKVNWCHLLAIFHPKEKKDWWRCSYTI